MRLANLLLAETHNAELRTFYLEAGIAASKTFDIPLSVLVSVFQDTEDVDVFRSAFKNPVTAVVHALRSDDGVLVAVLAGQIERIIRATSRMLADDVNGTAIMPMASFGIPDNAADFEGRLLVFDRMEIRDMDTYSVLTEYDLNQEDADGD